ncbi:MAG TPA: hypothetical protein VF618_00970 [Thermoanaerobaculia bacterium]
MTSAEDQVVARIGERRITAAEVHCSRELAAENPRWLQGRSVEEACVAGEQAKFRTIAARELLERVCALEECDPSDAEIEPFRSRLLKDETQLRALVDAGLHMPRAVARVYRGEPLEKVYEEAIQPQGHTLAAFRREVEMFGSLERVERFLAKDQVALMRAQVEDRARQQAVRAKLRKRIDAAAEATNQKLEEAANDYLERRLTKIGVQILDDRFRLPSGREVFL